MSGGEAGSDDAVTTCLQSVGRGVEPLGGILGAHGLSGDKNFVGGAGGILNGDIACRNGSAADVSNSEL